jgi:cytochrome c oxidase subunit II
MTPSRPRVARTTGSIGVLCLALAGCLRAPVTREGRDVSSLYTVFLVAAAVVAAIVLGLTTFAVLRYRRRRDDTELPEQIEGNLRLELIWTGLPILTVIGLFLITFGVLNRVDAVSAGAATADGTGPVDVRVTAFRWGWRFEYPTAGVRVEGIGDPGPEVVVPLNQPIRVTLTSVDVVHAFFVPQFLFKRDAIPGRDNHFEFQVDTPGTYRGQCAEFCGVYHSRMYFSVRAVAQPEYAAWLATQRTASPAVVTPAPSSPGAPPASNPASSNPQSSGAPSSGAPSSAPAS